MALSPRGTGARQGCASNMSLSHDRTSGAHRNTLIVSRIRTPCRAWVLIVIVLGVRPDLDRNGTVRAGALTKAAAWRRPPTALMLR